MCWVECAYALVRAQTPCSYWTQGPCNLTVAKLRVSFKGLLESNIELAKEMDIASKLLRNRVYKTNDSSTIRGRILIFWSP